MLHPFVSVPNAGPSSAPGLALSTSLHVGLLCLVLSATDVVRSVHHGDERAEEVRLASLPLRTTGAATRTIRRARRSPRPAPTQEPTLPALPPTFDVMLPEPAITPEYRPAYEAVDVAELGQGVGPADDVLALGLGAFSSRRGAGGFSGAYDERSVEKRATPSSENGKPRYPARMQRLGIQSEFNVFFVVDTSGAVETSTIQIPTTIQQEFTRAVLEVLDAWRFAPAEIGGRHVRQRVLQPFSFRLERGR